MLMGDFNFIQFLLFGKRFSVQGKALNMDHFQVYRKVCFCPLFMGQLFIVPT